MPVIAILLQKWYFSEDLDGSHISPFSVYCWHWNGPKVVRRSWHKFWLSSLSFSTQILTEDDYIAQWLITLIYCRPSPPPTNPAPSLTDPHSRHHPLIIYNHDEFPACFNREIKVVVNRVEKHVWRIKWDLCWVRLSQSPARGVKEAGVCVKEVVDVLLCYLLPAHRLTLLNCSRVLFLGSTNLFFCPNYCPPV